jgi:hypothetical protein
VPSAATRKARVLPFFTPGAAVAPSHTSPEPPPAVPPTRSVWVDPADADDDGLTSETRETL